MMTALLHAAMNNPNPEVVNLLIDAGADDVTDKSGRTALILAAMWNVPEVVVALLEAGSNPKQHDKEGKNVLDYALLRDQEKGTKIASQIIAFMKEAQ